MFWGLILKANKKYSQTVQKAFHLSQAALDLSKSGEGYVQVMLTSEENTYLLCTLDKSRPQIALDLNFDEGDQISLSTKGEGIVHLTGYLIPSEADLYGNDDSDVDEDSELELSPQKDKDSNKKERVAKKVAQKVNAKEVQEEDSDEDDLDDTFEPLKETGKKKGGAEAAGDEEDSDDDDDDDEDDDDDSDDEKMDDSKGGLDDDDDDDDDDEEDDDEDDDDEDDDEDDSEEEQPKAKLAKMDKKQGKQQQQNGLENGKAGSKNLKKDDKDQQKKGQQQQQQKNESKSRTLQGGLVIDDLKVGTGPEAKPGKKIVVYYEGRLKGSNKVFDSTTAGTGFKFALGRNEVIKGWDIGVTGMKVGGKRRLTVPPQLAYGVKGQPPTIPPNSTLVFDVELRNVF